MCRAEIGKRRLDKWLRTISGPREARWTGFGEADDSTEAPAPRPRSGDEDVEWAGSNASPKET